MQRQTRFATIPVSVDSGVLSRSVSSVSSFFTRCRPWTEFVDSKAFDRPESVSSVAQRLRLNYAYFRLNYSIILVTCSLLSLVGSPLSFFLIAVNCLLWFFLYLRREDPLMLLGHQISDPLILISLISISVFTFFFTGIFGTLVSGIGIGVAVSIVHGIFRNPDGLFLDEKEAVSSGLIRSSPNTDRV